MKNKNKIFIVILFVELAVLLVLSFVEVSWPDSCTPNFFNPFGKTSEICAQVITPSLSPVFYIVNYLFALTLVIYFIYVIRKNRRKNK